MAHQTPDHDLAIREFKAKVIECTDEAICHRQYVLVSKLIQWLKSKVRSGGYETSQASRLLDAAYRRRITPALPITKEQLSDGEDRCLLVFSILLELGRGELIDLLWRREKVDKRLPIALLDLQDTFQALGVRDPYRVAEAFDDLQWRFCAAKFELNMGREYPRQRIMPIRRKLEINEKGGTAQLWQIEVLEEFVGRELREAVKASAYDPKDGLGKRYEFALKSFKEGNRGVFENEVDAFLSLRGKKGMVQYLGEYGHKEIHAPSKGPQIITPDTHQDVLRTTYNILLEYGESDLEEYFADTNPPYLQPEVEAFWKGLFAVADAVQGIHHLKTNTDGRVQEFYGWHADIKPDNVLVVQKKFKLADPGFVRFVKKTDQDPRLVLLGGTETYAAPERHRGRDDTQCGFSQTIDTWSLGCVFSIAATWVVLGYQGIQQFNRIREKSIQKLVRDQQKLPAAQRTNPKLTAGDYFHDGIRVLPDVLGWHSVLRSALRQTDTVTGQVLDLVDQKLLLEKPALRLTAGGICLELKEILERAQNQPRIEMSATIEEFLREVDDDALSKPRDSSSLGPPATLGKSLTIIEARKSKLKQLPIMKTTHRSQVLRSTFSQQHFRSEPEEPTITSSPRAPSPPPTMPGMMQDPSRTFSQSPESQIPAYGHDSRPSTVVHTRQSTSYPSIASPTRPRMPRRSKTSARPGHQNVFQAREEVEIRGKAKGLFGGEQKDKLLERHFGNRDIKFLVDNAETMDCHWYEATFLLQTLLLKARGQDENGMDLLFTSGLVKVEGREGRGSSTLIKKDPFMAAMKDPNARPQKNNRTDMRRPLGDIFDKYVNEAKRGKRMGHEIKNLTLIVLTDGIWDGMNKNKEEVRELIITFVKNVREIVGDLKQRPVSIEFIQFGCDEDATYRLWVLDNHLKYDGVPDIIDTEHSSGDVNKMLLGSFVEEFDEKEEEEDDDTNSGSPTPQPDVIDGFGSMGGLSKTSTHRPVSSIDQTPRHSVYTPSSESNSSYQIPLPRQSTTHTTRAGNNDQYAPEYRV